MRDKVLIIADQQIDGQQTSADHIENKIRELGGTCIRLRLKELARKQASLFVTYEDGRQHLYYSKDNTIIDLLDEVKSVLFWRPYLPDEIKNTMRGKMKTFYRGEWAGFMTGIYHSLKDCFWMNPFPMNIIYEEKIYQLKLAQQIGFRIPNTMITTSLSKAGAHFQSEQNDIIYKPFSQVFFEKKKKDGQIDYYALYTTIIDKKDLVDAEDVRATPNIFQTYIPKKTELRITCVGNAVMACEILSQQSEVSKHDWRHYDFEKTPYRKHALPAEIEKYCLQLLRTMGLTYGCIDMILTPDDKYVFLELNPNGQFGWIESLTGYPITENIARMLIKGSIDYEIKKW